MPTPSEDVWFFRLGTQQGGFDKLTADDPGMLLISIGLVFVFRSSP